MKYGVSIVGVLTVIVLSCAEASFAQRPVPLQKPRPNDDPRARRNEQKRRQFDRIDFGTWQPITGFKRGRLP